MKQHPLFHFGNWLDMGKNKWCSFCFWLNNISYSILTIDWIWEKISGAPLTFDVVNWYRGSYLWLEGLLHSWGQRAYSVAIISLSMCAKSSIFFIILSLCRFSCILVIVYEHQQWHPLFDLYWVGVAIFWASLGQINVVPSHLSFSVLLKNYNG